MVPCLLFGTEGTDQVVIGAIAYLFHKPADLWKTFPQLVENCGEKSC